MHFVFYCIVDSLKDKCSYLKKTIAKYKVYNVHHFVFQLVL